MSIYGAVYPEPTPLRNENNISILNHVEYGSGETGLSDLIMDFENSNKFIITDSLSRKKMWVKLMISEFGRVLDVKAMSNPELYFDNMGLIDDFLFSLGNWTTAKGITDSGKTIFFTDEYVIVLFRE